MARKGRVRRSMKEKAGGEDGSMKMGIRASSSSVMAAASMSSSAAMALVDEWMSTEGTGLPFGLSNNVLGLDPVWCVWSDLGSLLCLHFSSGRG